MRANLKVKTKKGDEMTDREAELYGPHIKDTRTYLVVYHDEAPVTVYCDSMEPEDATFDRDLSWIGTAIEDAYKQGFKDGHQYLGEQQ